MQAIHYRSDANFATVISSLFSFNVGFLQRGDEGVCVIEGLTALGKIGWQYALPLVALAEMVLIYCLRWYVWAFFTRLCRKKHEEENEGAAARYVKLHHSALSVNEPKGISSFILLTLVTCSYVDEPSCYCSRKCGSQ